MNQAPRTSAIARAQNPEVKSYEAELLEWLAVSLERGNVQRGNQSGAPRSDFPSRFEDLFDRPRKQYLNEEQLLAAMAQFDKVIGRG